MLALSIRGPLLAWKRNALRCLSSNEQMKMLGFPDAYLAIVDASSEDTRCELAGDAMAVPVLVRLFATLSE